MGAPNYAPGLGGPGFAAQPFGANMNAAPEMAPTSAPNHPNPPSSPQDPVAVTWPFRSEHNSRQQLTTSLDEARPSIKPARVQETRGLSELDQWLMVKFNSFSATHLGGPLGAHEQTC
jgi:hypothetical protein